MRNENKGGSDLSPDQMRIIKKSLLVTKAAQADPEEDEDFLAKIPPHIRLMYRNVFLESAEGRKVLAHLLIKMGYNNKIGHPQEIGLHNAAQWILQVLGVGSEEMLYESLSTWAILPPEDRV